MELGYIHHRLDHLGLAIHGARLTRGLGHLQGLQIVTLLKTGSSAPEPLLTKLFPQYALPLGSRLQCLELQGLCPMGLDSHFISTQNIHSFFLRTFVP